MSVGRRVTAGVILGLVIIGLAAVVWRAANPPYATLFSRLSSDDAGEIVAVLRENGVPYRLADNGATILVPDDRVYETRLSLAAQGLPRGGVVGFEVFLESALGATDFDRQVRYNMALQGELTRTIREITGVLDARVHIVMPERRLFADECPAASCFCTCGRASAERSRCGHRPSHRAAWKVCSRKTYHCRQPGTSVGHARSDSIGLVDGGCERLSCAPTSGSWSCGPSPCWRRWRFKRHRGSTPSSTSTWRKSGRTCSAGGAQRGHVCSSRF